MGVKQKEITVTFTSGTTGRGKDIATIELKNYVVGGESGAKTYAIKNNSKIPDDWAKSGTYGIELTNGQIKGKSPNKATAASSFVVLITDTNGDTAEITIKLPKIT